MRTTNRNLLSLAALMLLLGLGAVQEAAATVRVSAAIQTPNLAIRIGSGPVARHVDIRRAPLPARHRVPFVVIAERDRDIARRLSRYTGMPRSVLLDLRRQGYRWVQIADWLQVPRPVLAAARDGRSWRRLLRHERGFASYDLQRCNDHDGPGRGGRGGRWDD